MSTLRTRRSDSATAYQATGTLRGTTTATLTGKTTGYVRRLEVAPGERVAAGQLLVVLDDTDASTRLQGARALLAEALAADAQVRHERAATQAALSLARTTQARMQELVSVAAVSTQEFDVAESSRQGAVARSAAAEAAVTRAAARVSQARAEVAAASTSVGNAEIRAPFEGIVIERRAQVGDLATPGMPLLVLEEDATLQGHVSVPESLARSVTLGQRAELEVEAVGRRFAGAVSEIVPAIDAGSRSFLVKVDLDFSSGAGPAREGLRPGMFVRARLEVGRSAELQIPLAAVSPRGSIDRVFVLREGRARLRHVSLGERREGQVAVLSGLGEGEELIVDPSHLRDGAAVSAVGAANEPPAGAPGGPSGVVEP